MPGLTIMELRPEMSGLQRTVIAERARLIRFLAARGAGDEAEDLLHELWEKVAAAGTQPIAEPLSYLFRAAENLIRDVRRSKTSRERRQFHWHEVAITPEEHPVGERATIARQELAAVQATLSGLGPRVEEIFRRCRLEGAGQAQVARDLGISLSSVEKDLQKAYRALAQLKAGFDAE
jgi:RNA polymerase sigma factor (sigma-70 family)